MFVKFNRFKLFTLEENEGGGGGKIGDNDRVKGGGVSGRARICESACVGCTREFGDGERERWGDESGDGNL